MNKTARLSLRFLYAGVITLCLTAMPGCSSYKLGSSLPSDIKVVYVPTFINKTSEPLLDAVTTDAAISEIQRDGTLSLGSQDKSDVILNVILTDLKLYPLRYKKSNSTTANEYRLAITASMQLKKRSTGKIMMSYVVVGERDFIPSGDLSTGKRDALPMAAKDLAHRIVERIVEYW